MLGLLQRVARARVEVEGAVIGAINAGLLVFVGVEQADTELEADRLLDRMLRYRVFADADGKMNLSLQETGGGLLLVPQFTLAADTRKGLRPSFSAAASPAHAARLFQYLFGKACTLHPQVASGRFAADMQVALTNDGPVTFLLRAESPSPSAPN